MRIPTERKVPAMRNRQLVPLVTVFLLIVALVLSVTVAYARYREELTGDLGFQAKPLAPVAFTKETWEKTDDSLRLTFSVEKTDAKCRVYLAVSEGFTAMDQVIVTLTIPGEEPLQLVAAGERIPAASGIYNLFGDGYVFRFIDGQTGQELPMELLTDTEYVLSINGLEDAIEYTGLLRLFIERIEE